MFEPSQLRDAQELRNQLARPIFENGPMWKPYAVRDGNLVTGQNPASSALVAQHFIEALS
jgi:putative intracellular protease/amidase